MLRVTQLRGFNRGGEGSSFYNDVDIIYPPLEISPWTSVFSVPLTTNSSGWFNFTFRQIIPASFTFNGTQVRLVLQAHSTGAINLSAIYIGQQAASGDTYDMKASGPAPVQLTVGGSTSFQLLDGIAKTTDPISFFFDMTKNHIVSFFCPAGGNIRLASGVAGAIPWTKGGSVSDAATADATGYTSGAAGNVFLVTKIQVI